MSNSQQRAYSADKNENAVLRNQLLKNDKYCWIRTICNFHLSYLHVQEICR